MINFFAFALLFCWLVFPTGVSAVSLYYVGKSSRKFIKYLEKLENKDKN